MSLGGAFEQGLGDCALYNGTTFAQKNIVSVVINYRLGILGYLASPSMKGNYGILDQRMALQWTQANIRGFGGDPKRVTIAGQSAGAMSVGCHLTSKGSQGLFSQAIQESNPLALPYHERASAAENAATVAEYLHCPEDDVECLRTKSVEEILDAQKNAVRLDFDNLFLNFLPFAPLVEPGGELPEQPFYSMANGNMVNVPSLQGSMYDEGQLFVYELFTKPMTEAKYKGMIRATFGAKNYDSIMKMYPFDVVPGSTDGREALNVLGTDLLFYCPLRNMTTGYQKALGKDTIPSFLYRFKHVISFDCWGENYTFCVGKVCHGSELPFVFNVFTDGASVAYTPTTAEVQLTSDLSSAWANFIRTGDPNKGEFKLPVAFPQYDYNQDTLIVLDEPGMTTDSHIRDSYCDFWDSVGYFY